MFVSSSNSNSIRNIENTYGFNISKCKHWFMNRLVGLSGKPVITKLDDLMLGEHKFDIENMTDIEKSNLLYLVLSTKEVVEVVERKIKCIYFKPKYKRLRFLMSYEDFHQICMDKLMLNYGILKFDANYSFDCAVQFWFDRVAGWKCTHKAKTADEVCVLDKKCNEDSSTTVGDLILYKDAEDYGETSLEVDIRINRILDSMDKTKSNRYFIKAGETTIPLSEYLIAKLFILYNFGKKELSKMIYNTLNYKLVSNQCFNKLYKQTLCHIARRIKEESKEAGEVFTFDIDDI